MKKTSLKAGMLAVAVLAVFSSCSREVTESLAEESNASLKIEQPGLWEKICSYVDAYWPSSATLSTTLTSGAGTSADASLMNSQNTAIKTFWRGSSVAAPTFRFVRNGTDWNST